MRYEKDKRRHVKIHNHMPMTDRPKNKCRIYKAWEVDAACQMFLKCIDLYYLLINQAAPAFQQDVAMVSRPKQARAFHTTPSDPFPPSLSVSSFRR